MLRSASRRACRSAGAVLALSPNRRSNAARGLFSIGSGVVGLRQQSVLTYAQLKPASQAPAISVDSRLSSSDATWVWRPSSAAAIWSIDTPASTSAPSVGLACTPVRNAPPMRPCPPAGSPFTASAGRLSSPVSTSRRSRNGASGARIGENSKSTPSARGVQLSITAPCGT